MSRRVIGLCLLSVLTFRLSTQAQGRVTLVSPQDGETNVSTRPTFTWNQTGGAGTYDIQVSDRSDMARTVAFANVGGTSYTPSTALDIGETYFWRVRGRRNGPPGRWSAIWSLTTGSTTPDQVSLLTPGDGETGVSVTPTLTWSSSGATETYELQIATDPDFTSTSAQVDKTAVLIIEETVGETEFTSPELTYGEAFYWRVRGVNDQATGPWSVAQGFITQRGGAQQVQLLEPEQGAFDVSVNPTLVWKSVAAAAAYHVQVGRNLGFSGGLVFEDLALADTAVQIFDLTPDTLYTWRVRADNAGSKNWSVTGSFATTASPTSSDQEVLDGSFELHQNYPNPFGIDHVGTVIPYELAAAGPVRLSVYDARGRHVVDLANGWKRAGRHHAVWTADGLASGAYFVVLQSGAATMSTKTRAVYLSR